MDTYKVDYHIHSYYSDGLLSPVELVKKYHDEGYDIISITDHDTVCGLKEAFTAGEALNMNVVSGIEFSTRFEGISMHLLGYKFDPENAELLEATKWLKEVRRERNQKLISILCDMGYELNLSELEAKTKGGYVGKPTIARELVNKGYIDDPKKAFTKDILLSDEIENLKKEKIDTVRAIEIINNAGGISVLAHSMKIKGIGVRGEEEFFENLDNIVYKLKKSGLKGIECIYPEHTLLEQHRISQIASKYHLHMTEGSDFHGGDLK